MTHIKEYLHKLFPLLDTVILNSVSEHSVEEIFFNKSIDPPKKSFTSLCK